MSRRKVVDNISIGLDLSSIITLKVPINKNNSGSGAFPLLSKTVNYNGKIFNTEKTLGFAVDDPTGGQLYEPSATCLEIKFKYLKPVNNIIYFFSTDGRISTINIISVPLHNHSSIYQGGPAYGTYHSESDKQST